MEDVREVRIGYEDEYLVLRDVFDGSSTRASDGELWAVTAELVLRGLRASARVWLSPALDPPLARYFRDLAASWRELDVARWQAYEQGMALSATHDGLGHITIAVEVRELSYAGWLARGDVPLDAGQLEQVARDVERFLT